jgi:hypothetical protein
VEQTGKSSESLEFTSQPRWSKNKNEPAASGILGWVPLLLPRGAYSDSGFNYSSNLQVLANQLSFEISQALNERPKSKELASDNCKRWLAIR